MYTKSPDYIICDCGCPHCSNTYSFYNNNNCNEICYTGKKSPLVLRPKESTQKSAKLLPLRETLTEYYQRLLIERADLMRGGSNGGSELDETAQLKQCKNQRNEAVKQRQQRQQQQQQQRQRLRRNSWRNQIHEGGNQNSTDKTFWSRAGKQVTTFTTTVAHATADSDCDDVF